MILVTGGTGLVGIHLLMELSDKEVLPIRAIYRSLKKKEEAKKVFETFNRYLDVSFKWSAIEWVNANINDIPSLQRAFIGVTQVYHCAGFISWNTNDFDALKKINIEGTANVVNLSINSTVEKFCHVSSISTLNLNLEETIYTEKSQWNPEIDNSVYAISKFGAEMEVMRGIQEGLNAVIVNPGVIIGPGFFNAGSGKLFQKVNKGIPFYTLGETGYVGVWDTVKIMHILMQKSIFEERFIIISENLTNRYVIKTISNFLSVNSPEKSISKKWLLIYSYFLKTKSLITGNNPLIPISLVDSMFKKSHYSNSKIKKVLNWQFEKMESVLKETSQGYLLVNQKKSS